LKEGEGEEPVSVEGPSKMTGAWFPKMGSPKGRGNVWDVNGIAKVEKKKG